MEIARVRVARTRAAQLQIAGARAVEPRGSQRLVPRGAAARRRAVVAVASPGAPRCAPRSAAVREGGRDRHRRRRATPPLTWSWDWSWIPHVPHQRSAVVESQARTRRAPPPAAARSCCGRRQPGEREPGDLPGQGDRQRVELDQIAGRAAGWRGDRAARRGQARCAPREQPRTGRRLDGVAARRAHRPHRDRTVFFLHCPFSGERLQHVLTDLDDGVNDAARIATRGGSARSHGLARTRTSGGASRFAGGPRGRTRRSLDSWRGTGTRARCPASPG
jgi:hypothetical protein